MADNKKSVKLAVAEIKRNMKLLCDLGTSVPDEVLDLASQIRKEFMSKQTVKEDEQHEEV
jgi:hypothetical protein